MNSVIKNQETSFQEFIGVQHELKLGVLMHGGAEIGDLFDYFGEQFDGYLFSGLGWV